MGRAPQLSGVIVAMRENLVQAAMFPGDCGRPYPGRFLGIHPLKTSRPSKYTAFENERRYPNRMRGINCFGETMVFVHWLCN